MNGSLPEIDSFKELNELTELSMTAQFHHIFWLNAVLKGDRFVWKSSGEPVNHTILPMDPDCLSTCCNLYLNSKTLKVYSSACGDKQNSRLMCVKPVLSNILKDFKILREDLESSLKRSVEKNDKLAEENKELKADVDSLKTTRIVLFVLLSLTIAVIVLIGMSAFYLFKKVRSVMP